MTEIITGLALPHVGHSGLDLFPDSAEHSWEQQYIEPIAMLTASWPQSASSQMSGVQSLDVRFDHDTQGYFYQPQHIPSPHIGYQVSDVGTPSSHQEAIESYTGQHPSTMHLYPYHTPGPIHSPHSSISAVSPLQTPLESPPAVRYNGKPHLASRNSAPEARDLKATTTVRAHLKHRGSSGEEDDSYGPDSKRGRKRQRIPHTAVERRYRENLNAHLEKLRQTVPTLASKKGPGGGKVEGEGVKPSKCEILHAAIEYIGAQEKVMAGKDKHIAGLMDEIMKLRRNQEQMQDWIRGHSH
ncbi:uncharacterized protein LTR77_002766 [Saxophila tyrrhenica]|uniref:BHLH domain-containing protein n=1 Tax=Saxophila tyrrhenica TaxID=1690608 RepID=A0AAV9PG49_9PEZI|nr:hypothetical protein LTR77_002766 [Saxophila tyrrhenica]